MDARAVANSFLEVELEILRQTVPRARQTDTALQLARRGLSELRELEGEDEITFEIEDPALHRIAAAMAVRYGLDLYRRPGMPHGEMIVLGPRTFVHTIYWAIANRMMTDLGEMFIEFAVEVLGVMGAPLPEEEPG